jgi:short-subunit dehydrogenase
MAPARPEIVVITGASAGIGRAAWAAHARRAEIYVGYPTALTVVAGKLFGLRRLRTRHL